MTTPAEQGKLTWTPANLPWRPRARAHGVEPALPSADAGSARERWPELARGEDPRAAHPVVEQVARALRDEHALELPVLPSLVFNDDALEITGDVASIASKRRVLRTAGAHPAIRQVIDRLRVTRAGAMSDALLAEHVAEALLDEACLFECAISSRAHGALRHVQQPAQAQGAVCVAVENNVVTLVGELPTLAHKRLAGVVAWSVPGTCDVIDQIGILQPARDDDDELYRAVRTALDKDPILEASQIRVHVSGKVVALSGLVWSSQELGAAEHDVWSVFGVVDVKNELRVADVA